MYEVPWENTAGGEVHGKARRRKGTERTIKPTGQEVRGPWGQVSFPGISGGESECQSPRDGEAPDEARGTLGSEHRALRSEGLNHISALPAPPPCLALGRSLRETAVGGSTCPKGLTAQEETKA